MEDFEYRGILCEYLPHPNLIGKYEISIEMDKNGINFLGRFNTRKECRNKIDLYLSDIDNYLKNIPK